MPKVITKEYRLAMQIVLLQDALDAANKLLNEEGMLGVLPSYSFNFRNGKKQHAKVRKILKRL